MPEADGLTERTGAAGPARRGHRLVLPLKLAVTATALAYLFGSDRLQLSQFAIRPGGVGMIAGALLLILAWRLVSQARYWWLLRSGGLDVPLGRVLQVGFISSFFNSTLLGGLGFVSADAIRAAYLVRERGEAGIVIGASLMDRILGMLGLMCLAVLALQAAWTQTVPSPELRLVAATIHGVLGTAGLGLLLALVSLARGRAAAGLAWIILGGAAIYLFGSIWESPLIPGVLLLIPLGAAMLAPVLLPGSGVHRFIVRRMWLGRHVGRLLEVLLDYRKKGGSLSGCFLLSLLVHVLAFLGIAVTGMGLSLAVAPSLQQVWFAAPPATALNIVPLPANGLGVGEAAFDGMLRFCAGPDGNPLTGGAALFLGHRILVILSGLAGLPFYLVSRRPRIVTPDRPGPEPPSHREPADDSLRTQT